MKNGTFIVVADVPSHHPCGTRFKKRTEVSVHDDDPRFRFWIDLDAVDVGFYQLAVGKFDFRLLGQFLQSLELLFGSGPKFSFRG